MSSVNVVLSGEETDGVVSLVLNELDSGWPGPPLHRHDFDEAFYGLDGELTCHLGDELVTAAAGQMVFAPRGAAHTLANRSDAPARYLLVITPAGFERYFSALAAGEEITAELRATWPAVETLGGQIDADAPASPLPEVERGRISVMLSGDETGGVVSLMDNTTAPRFGGPPLHHHDFNEAFVVLEGEVTFRLGDEEILGGPGDFVHVPRGNVHCFQNRGEATARIILTFTPSGMEKFFEETLQRVVDPTTGPTEPVEVVAARYAEAAPRHGLEFVQE